MSVEDGLRKTLLKIYYLGPTVFASEVWQDLRIDMGESPAEIVNYASIQDEKKRNEMRNRYVDMKKRHRERGIGDDGV